MSHTRWDITAADRAQEGYQEARRACLFDRVRISTSFELD